jgi:hypothetical protein
VLLENERFQQACNFITKHARALDRKLFEYHFEIGSRDDVREELAKYQNSDGGFGNALEPDFRLKASSPMATSVGLRYCNEIHLDSSDTVIESAVRYLMNTYQNNGGYWPFTFMDVNEEPHAPWWHAHEISAPSEARWSNPNAEIVGYLNQYAIHVPDRFLSIVNERAQRNLESSKYIEGLVYDIICWNHAYSHLPDSLRKLAVKKIEQTIRNIIPSIQETLCEVRVFSLAPSPQSLLYQLHPDVVDALITSEITKQSNDGGWWPTWRWGQYEEEWEVAKIEWAGKLTAECLMDLDKFNLIESSE